MREEAQLVLTTLEPIQRDIVGRKSRAHPVPAAADERDGEDAGRRRGRSRIAWISCVLRRTMIRSFACAIALASFAYASPFASIFSSSS